jgi:hypothetical protein
MSATLAESTEFRNARFQKFDSAANFRMNISDIEKLSAKPPAELLAKVHEHEERLGLPLSHVTFNSRRLKSRLAVLQAKPEPVKPPIPAVVDLKEFQRHIALGKLYESQPAQPTEATTLAKAEALLERCSKMDPAAKIKFYRSNSAAVDAAHAFVAAKKAGPAIEPTGSTVIDEYRRLQAESPADATLFYRQNSQQIDSECRRLKRKENQL